MRPGVFRRRSLFAAKFTQPLLKMFYFQIKTKPPATATALASLPRLSWATIEAEGGSNLLFFMVNVVVLLVAVTSPMLQEIKILVCLPSISL